VAFFIPNYMQFLPEEIDNYSLIHTEREPRLLAELNRETWANVMTPRMLSGHLQGRMLSMFSKMLMPKNILEIGTYTGYSALCLAEGLKKDGSLHTIDINEEYVFLAKKYFQRSDYSEQIIQHIGNAVNILPDIKESFQLAFIDADKENYSTYFDLIIQKIDVGGYIIADNVLWSGKVLKKDKDKETLSLDQYNKKVLDDTRLETILLPIRDGLMVSRKVK